MDGYCIKTIPFILMRLLHL